MPTEREFWKRLEGRAHAKCEQAESCTLYACPECGSLLLQNRNALIGRNPRIRCTADCDGFRLWAERAAAAKLADDGFRGGYGHPTTYGPR